MIDAAWMWLVNILYRFLENVWNGLMLVVNAPYRGFHSHVEPDLDAIQGKYDSHVPLLPQIALDLLAQAVAASAGITIGAKPQYEEMLHSPADWRPLYHPVFPEDGDE